MAAKQSDRSIGLGQDLESRRRRLAETVAPLAELPLGVGYLCAPSSGCDSTTRSGGRAPW
ncbi:hypothetical protein [Haloterrigena turkmenica]|uniref:hypothetical protein n=1 Tax=Haloterrigena turkmenica TaxID=62320 RepID=UPI000AC1276A|nr:hypothetical protein [Haloterrigena turkmenica]